MKPTDERLIAALIEHGAVRQAADAIGCSRSLIYKRMKDAGFRALYSSTRDDSLKAASAELSKNLTQAVRTLASIMNDESTASGTRLNACIMILQYGLRFAESVDIVSRLEALEQAQQEREST